MATHKAVPWVCSCSVSISSNHCQTFSDIWASPVQTRSHTGGPANLLLVLFNKILIKRPWRQQWQHFAVILMSMEAEKLTHMKISLLRIYSATKGFTDSTRLSAHGVSPKDLDQWAQVASQGVSKSARPELLLAVLARGWVSPLALSFRGLKPGRAKPPFFLSMCFPWVLLCLLLLVPTFSKSFLLSEQLRDTCCVPVADVLSTDGSRGPSSSPGPSKDEQGTCKSTNGRAL